MDSDRRLLAASIEQGLIAFTGAGVSRPEPSCLPLSRDIIDIFRSVLLAAASSHRNGPLPSVNGLERMFNGVPLELLLEILSQLDPYAPAHILSALHGASPNANHIALAGLQLDYPAKILFTLNFDHLHEAAIAQCSDIEAISLVTLEDVRRYHAHPPNNRPAVCHLHGSLNDTMSLIATLRSVGTGLATGRARVLQSSLESADLLCAGYSDRDIDTFPILMQGHRRLFWFSYSGSPPSSIAEMSSLRERLVVIHRRAGEGELADVLASISPSIARLLRDHSNMISSPRTCKDRLEEMKESLSSLLGVERDDRVSAARFVLASLCDAVGNRHAALDLLKDPDESDFTSTLYAARLFLKGHILERLGRIIEAKRVFSVLGRTSPRPSTCELARTRQASAALGLWKRNPFRLIEFMSWFNTMRSLAHTEQNEVIQRRRWQLGDCYHFLAEFFLVPSSTMALLPEQKNPLISKLSMVTDSIALFICGSVRTVLLRKALHAYLQFLRRSRRSQEDCLPGHTTLAWLRYHEVSAALGRSIKLGILPLPMAGPEEYYRWIGTTHGLANAMCTRGIVATYENDWELAAECFDKATSLYGTHRAGHLKVAVFRIRAKAWRSAWFIPHRGRKIRRR